MFVTTVVGGSIHVVSSFTFARRPYMRDVIFYIVAVGWTFAVMYKEDIQTLEAVGMFVFSHFLVLYLLNKDLNLPLLE